MKEKKETPYYIAEDLKKFGSVSDDTPELGGKFFDWYGSVFEDGTLSKKEKSIMALAVSFALQCPYCVDAYTNECIKLGFTKEQLSEANHVAAAMRGGSSLVQGVGMKNIADKKMMI